MKIYTEIDCVKLTKFEKMLLVIIKGVCYDFNHVVQSDDSFKDKDAFNNILIYISKNDKLVTFRVKNSAPGLFSTVKELILPLCYGFMPQGSFKEEERTSFITLQRFEVKKKQVVLNYFEAIGID